MDPAMKSLKMFSKNGRIQSVMKESGGFDRLNGKSRFLSINLALLILGLILSASIFYGQTTDKKSGTFTDPRDGQVYQWVKIGNQVWMAENLRFKTDSGSWCWENKEENSKNRGRLYNWAAAMQAAPPGWHLSSDEEWKELEKTLGLTKEQADQEGFRVDKDSLLAGKIKRTDAWPNEYKGKRLIITNETGFSAVITGFYALDEFTHEGYTVWWTCTDDKETAWLRCIGFFDNTISRLKNPKKFAFAVRCVKD